MTARPGFRLLSPMVPFLTWSRLDFFWFHFNFSIPLQLHCHDHWDLLSPQSTVLCPWTQWLAVGPWACTFTAFFLPTCIFPMKPIYMTLGLTNPMSYIEDMIHCQLFYVIINLIFAQKSHQLSGKFLVFIQALQIHFASYIYIQFKSMLKCSDSLNTPRFVPNLFFI